MTKPAMNIITRGIMMPHCGNKDWSRKVVQLAEARDHAVDAYNEYLLAHRLQNGPATMALRV